MEWTIDGATVASNSATINAATDLNVDTVFGKSLMCCIVLQGTCDSQPTCSAPFLISVEVPISILGKILKYSSASVI